MPLGLVERKQQQRRLEKQEEQENPYELETEVIVKTYEHQDAINSWVELFCQPGVDNDTRRLAARGLGRIGIGKDNALVMLEAVKPYFHNSQGSTNQEFFNLIWSCCENLPYPDFYQVWHPTRPQLDLANLPRILTQEIANSPDLASKFKLVCINGSKFIDQDNPAAKIYTEMCKADCPKCEDGTPKSMSELQAYWDLLESDK